MRAASCLSLAACLVAAAGAFLQIFPGGRSGAAALGLLQLGFQPVAAALGLSLLFAHPRVIGLPALQSLRADRQFGGGLRQQRAVNAAENAGHARLQRLCALEDAGQRVILALRDRIELVIVGSGRSRRSGPARRGPRCRSGCQRYPSATGSCPHRPAPRGRWPESPWRRSAPCAACRRRTRARRPRPARARSGRRACRC